MQRQQRSAHNGRHGTRAGYTVIVMTSLAVILAGCTTLGDLDAVTARIEQQIHGGGSSRNTDNVNTGEERPGDAGPSEAPATPAYPVSLVAPSRFVTWALDRNGGLWRWGANDQDLGITPNERITDETSPHRVFEDLRWREVSAGPRFIAGITEEGTLYTWGVNDRGLLGLGAEWYNTAWIGGLQSPAPEIRWRTVEAGFQSVYAITEDGRLYAWGNHDDGRLGIGAIEETNPAVITVEAWRNETIVPIPAVPAPARVGGRSDWRTVTAGHNFALAITESGELYAWGDNTYGQLGTGDRETRLEPVRVGTNTDWNYVSAGGRHVLGIRANGELHAWGDNEMGQLGLGHRDSVTTPSRVGTRTDWISAAAYEGFLGLTTDQYSPASAAVTREGILFTWGSNTTGQLGDLDAWSPDSIPFRTEPAALEAVGRGFISVAGGGGHALAVRRNGDVYAWGFNRQRQAGPFPWTGTDNVSPTKVALE